MKNKLFIGLFAVLILCSCNSSTSEENPFKKELNRELHRMYKTEASYEDIYGATLGDTKDMDVRNINVKESKILDTFNINLSTTNIASITYETLSPEEKEEFGYIGVIIDRKDKTPEATTYPIAALKSLNHSKQIAYTFAEAIKNESFEKIVPIMFEEEGIANTFEEYFNDTTEKFGDIVAYQYYGIGEAQYESKTYHSFLGKFIYSKGTSQTFYVNIFQDGDIITAYNLFPMKN